MSKPTSEFPGSKPGPTPPRADGSVPPPGASAAPSVSWFDLLAGLPSLVAAFAVVAAIWLSPSDPKLATTYLAEANRLDQQGDYEGSLVCCRRLLSIVGDQPKLKFSMVRLLDKLKKHEEAESIARSIAPLDKPGLPEAHYWLALRIFADNRRLTALQLAAERHLLRFLDSVKTSADAKALLGDLYVSDPRVLLGRLYVMTGRYQEARPYLEATVGTGSPVLLFDLAKVEAATKNKDELLRRAREALAAAKAQVTAKPLDKGPRVLWTEVCVFLGDYKGAIEVLDQSALQTGDSSFIAAKGGVYNAWAKGLERVGAEKSAERLQIIEQGLKVDPDNPELTEQVIRFLGDDPKTREKVRGIVRSLLVTGKAPAMAHFTLGIDAWANQRFDEARNHWEQAYRLNPRMPVIVNNLAWSLAFKEPVDLNRAISMVEETRIQAQKDPRLRGRGLAALIGTEGQILVKLGRWKDAVSLIEDAFAAGENSAELHRSIAMAYDKLGMTDLANEHRNAIKPENKLSPEK